MIPFTFTFNKLIILTALANVIVVCLAYGVFGISFSRPISPLAI